MPFVTNEQPGYTGAMSRFEHSPALQKLFTYKTKYEEVVELGVHDVGLGHFWVPRESVPLGKIDGRTFVPNAQRWDHKLELWEDQPECCARSLELLRNDESHILEAPTAWGKTVAGIFIACELGQPTLITVHKNDLVDSWMETIELAGINPKEVAVVQGSKIDHWPGKKIVIGMVQSLMRPEKFSDEFWAYFGFGIFDEVHTVGADKFSYVMQRLRARNRLGLSATPKRKDGKQQVIEYHIGPVRVHGTFIPLSPNVAVRSTGYRLPSEPYLKASGEWGIRPEKRLMHPGQPTLAYKAIAADKDRNRLIVRAAMAAYRAGRKHTLLMSALIEDHLWPLFHLLIEAGAKPEDIGWYIGYDPQNGKTITKPQLKSAAGKPLILTTDKMSSTGTNYPPWDTLCLCLPWPDVKQRIGRIMRRDRANPDKVPVVFDFLDADGMYQGFFKAREKTYFEVGAQVKRLKAIT